jgi:hypothetical protein
MRGEYLGYVGLRRWEVCVGVYLEKRRWGLKCAGLELRSMKSIDRGLGRSAYRQFTMRVCAVFHKSNPDFSDD